LAQANEQHIVRIHEINAANKNVNQVKMLSHMWFKVTVSILSLSSSSWY